MFTVIRLFFSKNNALKLSFIYESYTTIFRFLIIIKWVSVEFPHEG